MKNVDLQKIIYMNTLIAHRRTGTPEVFAQKRIYPDRPLRISNFPAQRLDVRNTL